MKFNFGDIGRNKFLNIHVYLKMSDNVPSGRLKKYNKLSSILVVTLLKWIFSYHKNFKLLDKILCFLL